VYGCRRFLAVLRSFYCGEKNVVSRFEKFEQRVGDCLVELSHEEINVGLIVIDSIDDYIGSDEKISARIKLVDELEDLAARSCASILVISNTSMKAGSRGGTVVYQELMNTARSVLMVATDLENEDRRLVLPIKHNLIAKPPDASFTVGEGGRSMRDRTGEALERGLSGSGSDDLSRKIR
jgi:hypothetical protein